MKRLSILSWIITALILGGLVTYLALSEPPSMRRSAPTEPPASVKVAGPRELFIEPGSSVEAQLVTSQFRRDRATAPLVQTTGAVAASLPKGAKNPEARWTFSSSESLTAYAEWRKSSAEVAFSRKQLESTQKLNEAKIGAQERVVDRMRKLVEVGSDSPRELAHEEATLQQTKLEARKLEHEAEAALRNAERSRAALERQLAQAGLDPEVLGTTEAGSALLVADIPESMIDRVRQGQSVRVRLYGLHGKEFTGTVNRVSPTVTREERMLRVLVVLEDQAGELKPGMFADVGVGTEPREALWAPTDGVLHIGRSDYLVMSRGGGKWSVVEVRLGETRDGQIEVLSGLDGDATAVGAGAVLLKPFVVEALSEKMP